MTKKELASELLMLSERVYALEKVNLRILSGLDLVVRDFRQVVGIMRSNVTVLPKEVQDVAFRAESSVAAYEKARKEGP